MADINLAFCRSLLSSAHGLVKLHFPEINLVKDAWVWRFMRDHWEFHGPDKFYWNGSAYNAYEARYKGWMAWLRSRGVDGDAEAA